MSLSWSQDTNKHIKTNCMYKISNKHVNTKVKNTKHLQSLNIEILRCKSNKTHTGLICWKLQNADEGN